MKSHGKSNGLFSLFSILPNLIRIAIYLAVYFYLLTHDFFPQWLGQIFIGVKVLVALEVLLASGRSLLGPLLGLIAGCALLYLDRMYNLAFITNNDAWQLIIVSIVGVLLSIIIKL